MEDKKYTFKFARTFISNKDPLPGVIGEGDPDLWINFRNLIGNVWMFVDGEWKQGRMDLKSDEIKVELKAHRTTSFWGW